MVNALHNTCKTLILTGTNMAITITTFMSYDIGHNKYRLPLITRHRIRIQNIDYHKTMDTLLILFTHQSVTYCNKYFEFVANKCNIHTKQTLIATKHQPQQLQYLYKANIYPQQHLWHKQMPLVPINTMQMSNMTMVKYKPMISYFHGKYLATLTHSSSVQGDF